LPEGHRFSHKVWGTVDGSHGADDTSGREDMRHPVLSSALI
jgi:hypothetical protein